VPSHCAGGAEGAELPRNLTILYPDGHREFWFTDLVFEPGDLLDRAAASWIVVRVGDPNAEGKHTTVVVRKGGRTAKADRV